MEGYVHDEFPTLKGCLYIDKPLVAASAEGEGEVSFRQEERTVYQYIAPLQQSLTLRVQNQVFEPIAGVAPDGLVGTFLYQPGKGGEAFGV